MFHLGGRLHVDMLTSHDIAYHHLAEMDYETDLMSFMKTKSC